MADAGGQVHVLIVTSRAVVSSIKQLTIHVYHDWNYVEPYYWLDCSTWTDSTIVPRWLAGSPGRFKTFMGKRIATIIELIPPKHWRHMWLVVNTEKNPAHCASRGLYPSELVDHHLTCGGMVLFG